MKSGLREGMKQIYKDLIIGKLYLILAAMLIIHQHNNQLNSQTHSIDVATNNDNFIIHILYFRANVLRLEILELVISKVQYSNIHLFRHTMFCNILHQKLFVHNNIVYLQHVSNVIDNIR